MAERRRDADFARFVAEHRGRLSPVADLMFADRARAEDVLDFSLAELYRTWSEHGDPWLAALRQVLYATPGTIRLPWGRSGAGLQLLDGAGSGSLSGIKADLAALGDEQRRLVILRHLCQLSDLDMAWVTDWDPAEVEARAARAEAELAQLTPDRSGPDRLRSELLEAAPLPPTDSADPDRAAAALDIAHGRVLVHRRLVRTAVSVVAVLVVAVLGLTQVSSLLQSRGQQAESELPDPTAPLPSPSVLGAPSPVASCDLQSQRCRDAILRSWRSDVARVATSYVDPRHTYFTGGSSSLNGRYDLNSWWRGQVGALELDLAPRGQGATEVHLEIAASRDSATPCGQRTRRTCSTRRFLDGNTFTLTGTIDVAQGLEVQYSPVDEQVISVVARNTGTGKTLAVTSSQLMSLVSDPRLRLPPL